VVSFDELTSLVVKNKDNYPQLLIYAAKMQVRAMWPTVV
jgi:hypothetical protein